MTDDIALYLHFPFCRRKCGYCSFVSYPDRGKDISPYIEALKRELGLQAAGQRLRSIYFGGGTPSLLSSQQLADTLSAIHSLFRVSAAAEVTMEANPGTIDRAYLAEVRASGINRLSLGVQSLDDDELRLLGRIHNAAEAKDAVRFAREAGFTNLSLDLIYGLPGQTTSSWQQTLNNVIALGPEHLSLYALTLEGDVPLQLAIERGKWPHIDSDVVAEQYELAEDILALHDYDHYEISNWAKEGFECRHNMVYWQGLPYLGVGVAAHSYVDGHRLANTADLDRYLAAFSGAALQVRDMDEEIGPELKLAETVILGLRMNQGVAIDGIQSRFGIDLLARYGDEVAELAGLGLVECAGGHLRLTRRGRLLGNEVFWRFLPDSGTS